MSHVAKVNIEVKSLDALRKAAKNLGLEWKENQTTYKWYGKWVNDYGKEDAAYHHGIKPEDYGKNAVHAISVPGNDSAYEIGVVRRTDSDGNPLEGYTLVWDFFANGYGMMDYVGDKGCGKLVAQYSREVMLEQAALQGYAASETIDEHGNIVIEMQDYVSA